VPTNGARFAPWSRHGAARRAPETASRWDASTRHTKDLTRTPLAATAEEAAEPPQARAMTAEAKARMDRRGLENIVLQHVLHEVPWVERRWVTQMSELFSAFLTATTQHLRVRLSRRLFDRWEFDGVNLCVLRVPRLAAEDFWRLAFSPIHFGNALAEAIIEFEDRVKALVRPQLSDLPDASLPFVFEAALDGVGPAVCATAIAQHVDILHRARTRKQTFAQLRDRQVHSHRDLIADGASML